MLMIQNLVNFEPIWSIFNQFKSEQYRIKNRRIIPTVGFMVRYIISFWVAC